MKVHKIMTKKVLTLKPSDSLYDAIKKLAKKGVSGAPVVTPSNKVIGIVSDADITNALDTITPSIRITSSKIFSFVFASLRSKKEDTQIRDELKEARNVTVRSVMNAPITINENATINDAISKLADNRINRLPVVTASKKLKGIVARTDIIRALSNGKF